MKWIDTVYVVVGTMDAVIVMLMGLWGAYLYLFQKDDKLYFERIFPATVILVLTSAVAVFILAVTRWVAIA